jgi:hypothetical protein
VQDRGRKENHLRWWFGSKSDSTRRQRLHGWRLWQAHCVENAIEPERKRRFSKTGMEVAYSIMAMSQRGMPYYLRKEVLTAVRKLLEVAAPGPLRLLRKSIGVKWVISASVMGMVRRVTYRDSWDLTMVLEYIRKGPPSEKFSRRELMGRTAFLRLVLVPYRLAGRWRREVLEEKQAEDGN